MIISGERDNNIYVRLQHKYYPQSHKIIGPPDLSNPGPFFQPFK